MLDSKRFHWIENNFKFMVANFNHITRSLIGTICKTFSHLKFIYSEKATNFCEIFTLLLSYAVPVKSKVKILQNFVAFSECMNFTPSDRIRLLLIFYCHVKSKQNLFWHFLIFFSMLILCITQFLHDQLYFSFSQLCTQ